MDRGIELGDERRFLVQAGDLTVADKDPQRREELVRAYGVAVTADNRKAVLKAGLVILSVKPQIMEKVLAEGAPSRGDTGTSAPGLPRPSSACTRAIRAASASLTPPLPTWTIGSRA